MVTLISPGVKAIEHDLTTIIPAVSSSEAGIAGPATWGPLNERVLIDSEDVLVARFGKPNNTTAATFFTAGDFLAYSNQLWFVRIADETTTTANNATAEATTGSGTPGTGFLVKNEDHYEANYEAGALNVGQWIARYPGALGNSLKVSNCPSSNAFESTLTGTVAVTANSTTVTGTGTSFTTEVVVGDILEINNIEIKVSAVANATSLTLATRHNDGAAANTVTRRWEYFYSFDAGPGTSTYATDLGGSDDEMHVAVVDEDGEFTGIKGTVLEAYPAVSKASDAKTDDGSTNYYKEVVNQQSRYVRWADHSPNISSAGSTASGTNFGALATPETFSLTGGNDGGTPSNADYIRGYNKFRSTEDVEVSFMLGADANQTRALHLINNIAEVRKDCIAILSPERADVVHNEGNERADAIAFRDTLPSTSYAVLDSGWKWRYDKYNDLYRYTPLNGDVAGVMAYTDSIRDPWWSPGGFNRGNIKNVVRLPYNPRQADRDQLYKKGINPVVTFPGQGTVLFGDKTLLTKPSAFDRINVRRLFIVLRKAISRAAQYSLFEFNDEFTRAQFRALVEPYLRDVQGRRGIYDFRVVCDETNNTGEVIDRNEFIGDIYIKPARSINFIILNFVAVRTSVDFSEIVGQF